MKKFAGLETVFNMNTKNNPYQFSLEDCLTEWKHHMKRQIGGFAIMVSTFPVIFLVVLLSIFDGTSVTKIVLAFCLLAMYFVGYKMIRKEPGYNLLAVARKWKKLLKQIRKAGLTFEDSESPSEVASILQNSLTNLAQTMKKFERMGKMRERAKLNLVFEKIHGIASELRFEVSHRGDFFANTGKVKFVLRINLQPAA